MCHSILHFWFLRWHWGIPVDRDGLWPLLDHLQTSPLQGHYAPPQLNVMLMLATYFASFINAATHTDLTFQLSFCHSNVINHFFSVTLNPSWKSLVLTHMSMNLSFLLLPVLVNWAASWLFSFPISLPSWGSNLLRRDTKRSPPAHPTWWWSPSSLAQSYSCIWAPDPAT